MIFLYIFFTGLAGGAVRYFQWQPTPRTYSLLKYLQTLIIFLYFLLDSREELSSTSNDNQHHELTD